METTKKTFWFIGAPHGYIPEEAKKVLNENGIPIVFTPMVDESIEAQGVIRVEERILLAVRERVSENVPLAAFCSQGGGLLKKAIFNRIEKKFKPLN